MTSSALEKTAQIGIIGAGTMGAGIAQVAAAYGHTVFLFDQNLEAIECGKQGVQKGLERLVAKGKKTQTEVDELLARITPSTALDELSNCQLIVEAITENLTIKRSVFAELEEKCSEDCIFASNTSSISITSLAAELKHPERMVGMHFFNPAPVMKLVEVVSGIATSKAVADSVHATATAWGKQAVYTKSTPGFIVNRVARPFYAEAMRVYEEGAADIVDIDHVIKSAGQFAMGPFTLMDLIGHDVNYAVTSSVFDAYYQDGRFKPSLTQKALIESGRLGRKSGQGFYDYSESAVKPSASVTSCGTTPSKVIVEGDSGVLNALVERIESNNIVIEKTDITGTTYFKVGSAVVYLTNGLLATEIAAKTENNTAVIDLALDYSSATAIAVAFADQCEESAKQDVIGLLNAIELSPVIVDDIPGLIVMRTVAMIANEAADTVNQGVCSVADVDTAMRGGVNYPCGPLTWADKMGIETLYHCLTNLQTTYGEDRYRVSPLIRRHYFSGKPFHV